MKMETCSDTSKRVSVGSTPTVAANKYSLEDMSAVGNHDRSSCQKSLLAYAGQHGYTEKGGEGFAVTFHLSQSVAGYDLVHLDALLQVAVVRDALGGNPLPPSHMPYRIPLPVEAVWQSIQGIPLYNTSSLTPEPEHLAGVHWFTKRNESKISRVAQRKRDGTVWQPDSSSGVYKEYRIPLPTIKSPTLVGYGKGDIEEVRRLLALVRWTGKKRAHGFGMVLRVEVVPAEFPHRYTFLRAITVDTYELLRPVPQQALFAIGLVPVEEATQQIAFSPPYWLSAHQAACFREGHQVRHVLADTNPPTFAQEHTWSVPEFLLYCERRELLEHPGPFDILIQHPKFQEGKGLGALCALSGFPITSDGAVAASDVLGDQMGNAGDYLKGHGSPWVSHEAALVIAQPKKFHRSLVALLLPDGTGRLWWPTLAVDPNNPKQERPLWREVVLTLSEKRKRGARVILICKDEPKSRAWPRARIGTIGYATRTPILFIDSELGISDVLLIDIDEVKRQMLFVEQLLEEGYRRTAIRQGLAAPSLAVLDLTLRYEQELSAMRSTAEFPFAWRIARSAQDRALRKGTIHG